MEKGKHSIIIDLGDKVIKKFLPNLKLNFEKEVYFLQKLQKFEWVPKIISYNPEKLEVVLEKIDGIRIKNFIEKAQPDEIKKVLRKILEICFLLDQMGIDKTEMTNPYKHIIISENRIVFIDWERAKESKKPKNVTSFIVYIYKNKKLLEKKGIKLPDFNLILKNLINYKRSYSRKEFEKLLEKLGL